MSKSKTTACIVTRDGMSIGKTELAIGDEVELTESQMEGHAGKFELAGIAAARTKASQSVKGIQKLQDENDEQSVRIEFLEEQNEGLENALGSKVEYIAKLDKVEDQSELVESLSQKIKELMDTNKTLTADLKKATKK